MSRLIDPTWRSRAPRLRHVAPFDGMRGFGVLGVMGGHALAQGTLSFAAIVGVFFVVSGFLITTLLLQEHSNTGTIALRKFYARRVFRLLPALYVMLAGSIVAGVIVKASGHMSGAQTLKGLLTEVAAAGVYVYNIVFPVNNGPWIDHLWTLSVEEQFYLVVGVVALVFIVRGGVRLVALGLLALVAVIQISRFFLVPGPLGTAAVAMWMQRPDALMIGMLAAIASAHVPDPLPERFSRWLGRAGWVATIALFATTWVSTGVAQRLGIHHDFYPENFRTLLDTGTRPHGFYWIQWGHTVGAWASAVIVLCAFRLPNWWPNRFLSWKPLVKIGGMLSYSLYLWHVPVQELLRIVAGDLPRPLWLALAVGVPFLVAIPSYRFIETRALAFKDRFAVKSGSRSEGALSEGSA